jgi:hypothetical protein
LWHSYFFALTIFPAAVSLVVFAAERRFPETLKSTYKLFRFPLFKLKHSFKSIYLSSLIGGASHIFFDTWTHRVSSYLLYPFTVLDTVNPFWSIEYEAATYIFVALLGTYSIYLWIKGWRKD